MKALPYATACLLALQLPSSAGDPSKDQTRLVKLELELGLRKADGLGAKHPVIRRLEANIGMIEKRVPAIRDEDYRKLLRSNRARLEDELDRLEDAGYGERHPARTEINLQLAEVGRRLEAGER